MKFLSFLLVALFPITAAMAQEAPAPKRMPRTPVSSKPLDSPHSTAPASRELQGFATIIDGEKLKIGKTELRLFGIVAPQLSASFGPQARAHLDALAGGQIVACHIRDRDRETRLLATCTNGKGTDLALALLRRGYAVAARGSIIGTDVALGYTTAEQLAQSQKLGLWSMATIAASNAKAEPVAAAPQQQPTKTEEPAPAPQQTTTEAPKESGEPTEAQMQASITNDLIVAQNEDQADESTAYDDEDIGFFERYQILISGLLMLATALCISATFTIQRVREKRDETKSLAAALRGELMAARSVCYGRAKSITNDTEDHTAMWPRIRSTLFQAYVGRLGLLGAELARQIASIYGQSGDYASLYNPAAVVPPIGAPKKQALETLIKRIDEVLPKLAVIEKTGKIPSHHHHHNQHQEPPRDDLPSPVALSETMPVASQTPLQNHVVYASALLMDKVRRFLSSLLVPPPAQEIPQPPMQADPQVAEYTAIIEADMERYQYADNAEQVDEDPPKKSINS